MRAQLLAILLTSFGVFAAIMIYQVDQMVFADKLEWSESQSRAQVGALSEAVQTEIRSLRERTLLAWPQLNPEKKEFGSQSLLPSSVVMITSLHPNGNGEWTLETGSFREGMNLQSWVPAYLGLGLKSVSPSQVPENGFGFWTLLDPSRKVFLFAVMKQADKWFALVLKPDLFQAVMDRQKGLSSSVFAVNLLGQTLAHTTTEYVGTLLDEDPIVKQLMKSESGSLAQTFETAKGPLYGMSERIPQTNLYVVISTPLAELIAHRQDMRWKMIFLVLGFCLLGSAAVFFFVREKVPPPLGPVIEPKKLPPPPADAAGIRNQAYTRAASSLAHELRGPLLSLLGRARLLRESTPDESLQKELVKLEEGAREAHGTLHKVLTYAGEKEEPVVDTSVTDVVQRTLRMLDEKIRERGIELSLDLQEVPPIQGQPLLLMKALDQIFTNSIEAMDRAPQKKLKIEVRGGDEGPSLMVSDTGEGIAPEHLPLVFDPFFTTKSSMGHSGLGLSLAMGILRSCGGVVQVESTRGQGTVLRIHFSKVEREKHVLAQEQKASERAVAPPLPQKPKGLPLPPSAPAAESSGVIETKPQPPVELPEVLDEAVMQQTLDMIDELEPASVPQAHQAPPRFEVPPVPPAPPVSAKPIKSSTPPPPPSTVVSEQAPPMPPPPPTHSDMAIETRDLLSKMDRPNIQIKKKEKGLQLSPNEIRKPGDRV